MDHQRRRGTDVALPPGHALHSLSHLLVVLVYNASSPEGVR
jgi:hypothetical protein